MRRKQDRRPEVDGHPRKRRQAGVGRKVTLHLCALPQRRQRSHHSLLMCHHGAYPHLASKQWAPIALWTTSYPWEGAPGSWDRRPLPKRAKAMIWRARQTLVSDLQILVHSGPTTNWPLQAAVHRQMRRSHGKPSSRLEHPNMYFKPFPINDTPRGLYPSIAHCLPRLSYRIDQNDMQRSFDPVHGLQATQSLHPLANSYPGVQATNMFNRPRVYSASARPDVSFSQPFDSHAYTSFSESPSSSPINQSYGQTFYSQNPANGYQGMDLDSPFGHQSFAHSDMG